MSTRPAGEKTVRFGVIGLNHNHIYGMTDLLLDAGAELVSFYADEADLAARFAERYLHARRAREKAEILEDDAIAVVDRQQTRYIDCRDTGLPFGPQLLDDIRHRTETAMPQAHTFVASELALEAQAQARRVQAAGVAA